MPISVVLFYLRAMYGARLSRPETFGGLVEKETEALSTAVSLLEENHLSREEGGWLERQLRNPEMHKAYAEALADDTLKMAARAEAENLKAAHGIQLSALLSEIERLNTENKYLSDVKNIREEIAHENAISNQQYQYTFEENERLKSLLENKRIKRWHKTYNAALSSCRNADAEGSYERAKAHAARHANGVHGALPKEEGGCDVSTPEQERNKAWIGDKVRDEVAAIVERERAAVRGEMQALVDGLSEGQRDLNKCLDDAEENERVLVARVKVLHNFVRAGSLCEGFGEDDKPTGEFSCGQCGRHWESSPEQHAPDCIAAPETEVP